MALQLKHALLIVPSLLMMACQQPQWQLKDALTYQQNEVRWQRMEVPYCNQCNITKSREFKPYGPQTLYLLNEQDKWRAEHFEGVSNAISISYDSYHWKASVSQAADGSLILTDGERQRTVSIGKVFNLTISDQKYQVLISKYESNAQDNHLNSEEYARLSYTVLLTP